MCVLFFLLHSNTVFQYHDPLRDLVGGKGTDLSGGTLPLHQGPAICQTAVPPGTDVAMTSLVPTLSGKEEYCIREKLIQGELPHNYLLGLVTRSTPRPPTQQLYTLLMCSTDRVSKRHILCKPMSHPLPSKFGGNG